LGKKMYKNINNGQIVSIGNEEIKLINKYNEQHNINQWKNIVG